MDAIDKQARAHQAPIRPGPALTAPGAAACYVHGWAGIVPSGDSAGAMLERCLARGGLPGPAGDRRVADEVLSRASGLSPRDIKRLDRFALCAVAAARTALTPMALDEDGRRELGVIVGTMTAGWTFTEPQLRALYRSGLDEISPYLASAWFPAAAQGQITIHLGLGGHAKTLATDRCAGAQAIGYARQRMRSGQERYLLAGAAESPVTPFVLAAYESKFASVAAPLTEGSAFLVLGAEPPAQDEPAVEIDGCWSRPLFSEAPLRRQVGELLARAGDAAQDGAAAWLVNTLPSDFIERDIAQAIREQAQATDAQIFFPNRCLGDCLAASGPLLAGLALEHLRTGGAARVLVLSVGHQCLDLISFVSTHRSQHGRQTH